MSLGRPEYRHRRCYLTRRSSGQPEFRDVGRYSKRLGAVVTDGLHRAPFHRFLAEPFLVRSLRLLVDERVTTVIVSFEIGWRSFAAQIAIDALIIDIKLPRDIFSVFVSGIGHIFSVNRGTECYEETVLAQRILLPPEARLRPAACPEANCLCILINR